MARKPNQWLNSPAPDWGEDLGYHGFSRDENYQCYRVVLSVLGKQTHIIVCKSQNEAARAYDAALWKLLPFTPARAKPNFPNDFAALRQSDVDTLAPFTNRLFDQCKKQLEEKGISVESLLKLREVQDAAKAAPTLHTTRDFYSEFLNTVKKAGFEIFGHKVRLQQRRSKLNFVKFRELTERFSKIEATVTDLQKQLEEYDSMLETHRDIFRKLTNSHD